MFDETISEAWRQRFGSPPPDGAPEPSRFLNHRSIRKFSSQPVPESVVSALIGSAQSAATSSNLQLWSVVSVQDPHLRERVATLAGNQDQVREAPWFFAFLADLHRVHEIADTESAAFLDFTEYEIMAIVDAALAAERMVCAAESLGLGICYIGAMRNDPFGVKELLKLPTRTFCPFGLCLGYPAEPITSAIKPKLRPESVWFREAYGESSLEEYDLRMRDFYESQGMKGEFTWSMRSAKRLTSLTGREVLKPFLDAQGFGKR